MKNLLLYSKIKVLLIIIYAILVSNHLFSQTSKTINPLIESKNNEIDILGVGAFEEETVVIFSADRLFTKYILINQNPWIKISPSTYIEFSTPKGIVKLKAKRFFLGYKNDSKVEAVFNRKYYFRDFPLDSPVSYTLIFDAIPSDIDNICIKEDIVNGFNWMGVYINPRIAKDNLSLGESQRTIESIHELINKTSCSYRGIYERIGEESTYQLAFLENDKKLVLVYISDNNSENSWKTGDIKAELRSTAYSNTFKADWYTDEGKLKNNNCIISFDEAIMKIILDGEEVLFIKMGGEKDSSVSDLQYKTWSGSGFALNNGYIVTNYHVIEDAHSIKVNYIEGPLSKEYSSEVVAKDKTNDLAIIRINDPSFSSEYKDSIPYSINYQMVDVGEDVWVLGYPLTQVLGNEIKLTTGVISSKSGYQGDVSTYQISVPIQPGNSGGPLFDSKGNIVGIVNAGVPGAENVGYAIKTVYLKNLVDSFSLSDCLPTKNTISSLPLKDQVKTVNNFVFMITCSSK